MEMGMRKARTAGEDFIDRDNIVDALGVVLILLLYAVLLLSSQHLSERLFSFLKE